MRRASTSSCSCCNSASFRRSTSLGSFNGSPRRNEACDHSTGLRRSGKRHRSTGLISVSQMVRMPFQYSERPIHLFQQDYACQFMCQCHLSDGAHKVGFAA